MERLIFLDTETTGMPHLAGHRVVEIGAIEAISRQLTGKHFHRYLNPERACDLGAFKVHQLSDDFLAKQPKFADVVADFLDFLGDATLVIHNAEFDMGFLQSELKRAKKPALTNTVIDSLKLARGIVQGSSGFSLDKLCDFFQVDRSGREAHGALLDAQLLAQVYLRMTRQQIGLDLDGQSANPYRDKIAEYQDSQGHLPLKAVPISEESRQSHQALRAKSKAPHFWA